MNNFPRQLFSVVILSFLLIPVLAGAQTNCPPGSGNIIRLCNPLVANSFQELILNIVDFLFTLAIPIVTLMIIVGGFYFITAAGEPAKITTGKNLILWAVVGFIVILLAKGIIDFIQKTFIR